ncbi:MAG: hypothetical protein ACRDMJ_19975 [Solirubrobacteraceae bacterium]
MTAIVEYGGNAPFGVKRSVRGVERVQTPATDGDIVMSRTEPPLRGCEKRTTIGDTPLSLDRGRHHITRSGGAGGRRAEPGPVPVEVDGAVVDVEGAVVDDAVDDAGVDGA